VVSPNSYIGVLICPSLLFSPSSLRARLVSASQIDIHFRMGFEGRSVVFLRAVRKEENRSGDGRRSLGRGEECSYDPREDSIRFDLRS